MRVFIKAAALLSLPSASLSAVTESPADVDRLLPAYIDKYSEAATRKLLYLKLLAELTHPR